MQVFVFEYVAGGGLWESPGWPPLESSLIDEAWAMLRAIVADFCSLANVEVWSTRDVRLPERYSLPCQVASIASAADERTSLVRFAAAADWSLLIAPESGGALERRCEWVTEAGGKLLS